jgi:ferredoxin
MKVTMDDNDPKVTRKIRSLTMKIDRSLCIGAATCIAIAPKAWALDDEAKAIILDTAADESDETLISAARGCPVMAIILTDDTGKQIFP